MTPTSVAQRSPRRKLWRSHFGAIVVLIAVAGALRLWSISHTEVMARDGVGFAHFAWQLEHQDWCSVLRNNQHPPLYPLSVLAVSVPVRYLCTEDGCAAMQLSAQIVSGMAGTLLVVPMYLLGSRIFNRRIAFWSVGIFQCLAVASRVLADALSEGLFLLMAAAALLSAFEGLARRSHARFSLCGLFIGLAYLARPEGVLLVASVGGVLIVRELVSRQTASWRCGMASLACLVCGALIAGGPYVAVIHRLTNKTTGRSVLHALLLPGDNAGSPSGAASSEIGCVAGPGTVLACVSPMGLYWSDILHNQQWRRLFWSLVAVLEVLLKSTHYVGAVAGWCGLFYFRQRLRRSPGAWFLITTAIVHCLVLWRVGYVAGYVAERHILIVMMCGIFWAVAALDTACRYGFALLSSRWRSAWRPQWFSRFNSPILWSNLSLTVLTLCCVPKSLESLHANRAGFHAAGLWLATHCRPEDDIVDPFCWAEFYAGQVQRDAHGFRPHENHRGWQYIVLGECTRTEHERLPLIPLAERLAQQGTPVYEWRGTATESKGEKVTVYGIPPDWKN